MGLDNIPEWWTIMMALGILLLLLYWDVQSRPKRLRWARFTAIIVVVCALFAIYLAPYQTSPSKQEKVVWLTEFADAGTIDSLKSAGFVLVESNEEYDEVVLTKGIEQLIVVGDGLEQWELDRIRQMDEFIPSKKLTEGVVDYSMGNAIERSSLEIEFQLSLNKGIKLVLSGTGIETVEQEVTDAQKITLEVVPSLAGYLTYQLDGIREGDTLFSEVLPVLVQEKQSTNVLMIANTPSFEFRGLKNYLGEAGFGIAERLKVSTDLYHQAFTNLNERRLTTLTNRLLDDFQLIVIDAVAYQDLTRREQQRIEAKLERGELGVVLMGGKGALQLVAWKNTKSETLQFNGAGGEVELTGSKWQLAGSVNNIVHASQSIAQIKSHGLGQIVRPLFTDSYSLKLQAERKLYGDLWQRVLKDVVGKIESSSVISVADFPRVDEPTEIQLIANELETLKIDSIRLAPSQLWFDRSTWNTNYWPLQRGWQSVSIDDEQVAQFFAFDSTDWTLQKRRKKRAQTAAHITQRNTSESSSQPIRTPISKWFFLGLFLVGMTFLWVEQRVQ